MDQLQSHDINLSCTIYQRIDNEHFNNVTYKWCYISCSIYNNAKKQICMKKNSSSRLSSEEAITI